MTHPLTRVLAVCALVAAVYACTKVPTDATTPTAIELAPRPEPSIVAGDSLRDTLGVAAPFRATVFNSNGDTIHDAPVRFLSLDTALHVDSLTGFAYASSVPATPARIVVTAGNLQTLPQVIAIVPLPDSVAPGQDSVPTIRYLPPDNAANAVRNTTANPVQVRVFSHATTGGTAVPVDSFLVHFEVTDPAPTIADSISLLNERGDPSAVDTTVAGVAGRSVRIHPKTGASGTGSVTVVATVRYRGDTLGDPVSLVVPLTPGP